MFLPWISLLRRIPLLLAALVLVACGRDGERRDPLAEDVQVVAGLGDVSEDSVDVVRRLVARELPELRRRIAVPELRPFFVHVHASRQAMPAALLAGVHEDAPGFAVLGRHQIHIVLGVVRRTGSRLAGVVRHELVHELLDQYAAPNGALVPRWFHEGLAQLLAGDTYLGAGEADLWWRVGSHTLFRFPQLRDAFPTDTSYLRIAYAQSHSFVAWLVRNHGLPELLRVVREVSPVVAFDRILANRTGDSLRTLDSRWRDYLVNGSGAQWRILSEHWFGLLMIAALPVLVLALMRRLSREAAVRRLLGERERAARSTPALATSDELHGPPPPPDLAQGDGERSE